MHAIETGSFQAIVLDDTIHGGRSVDGLIQAIRQKLGIEVGMIMISSDNSHKQMEVGGENCVEISKPFGSEKIQQLNAELSRMLKPFEYPEE
ncbi:MAG: hypothetical protein JWO73_497 [Candidatus Taylorbacteria bacterium]|nr:hypothetical protein [Candidatus Taylorbacteria bacterium]